LLRQNFSRQEERTKDDRNCDVSHRLPFEYPWSNVGHSCDMYLILRWQSGCLLRTGDDTQNPGSLEDKPG
jgi:hypothetical protein